MVAIPINGATSHIAMTSPCLIIPLAPDAPSLEIAQIGGVLGVLANLEPKDFAAFLLYMDRVAAQYTQPHEVSALRFTRQSVHAMLEICQEAMLARQEAGNGQK